MSYQVCKRCICDTTVPAIKFDSKGICNFCKLQDKLEKRYPLNNEGNQKLQQIITSIKKHPGNGKFNCVVGISGGRDSTYTLHLVKKIGLKPLAVHFNDGFGNPVAGENMKKIVNKLKIPLITISSDWREGKDIRIAFLKASTPDLEEGADIGIATALYGVANLKNIKYIIIGQSFRTEGIAPLEWNYLDGKYLKAVHKQFGSVKLRGWKPSDPGFNLGLKEMFYYSVLKGIKVIPLLYYNNYVRNDVEKTLKKEYKWINTGAHYFDDLYQSLMAYVLRVKFNIDRRKYNYSALVRSGQMDRKEAVKRVRNKYHIENSRIINLCTKRLGISNEEFKSYLKLPKKTFKDYPNNYNLIKKLKIPIFILSSLHFLPSTTYDKYFEYG